MKLAKLMTRGIAGLMVTLATAQFASAELTVSDYDNGSLDDPLTGEYFYSVDLAPGSNANEVVQGDGWVLYDFPGLITSGSKAPTLTGLPFNMSVINVESSLLGNYLSAPTASDSNTNTYTENKVDIAASFEGTDNPDIDNYSFVYDSSTPVANVSSDTVGLLTIWTTDYGPNVTVDPNGFNGSVDSSGTEAGHLSYEGGNNSVPVPEPTSLAALGVMGLILSGGRRLRRAKA